MDTIQAIISTLNKIEVHGKDNLDMLLGCIMLLERMITAPEEDKPEEKEVTEDG